VLSLPVISRLWKSPQWFAFATYTTTDELCEVTLAHVQSNIQHNVFLNFSQLLVSNLRALSAPSTLDITWEQERILCLFALGHDLGFYACLLGHGLRFCACLLGGMIWCLCLAMSLLSQPGKVNAKSRVLRKDSAKNLNQSWMIASAFFICRSTTTKFLLSRKVFEKSWEYAKEVNTCL